MKKHTHKPIMKVKIYGEIIFPKDDALLYEDGVLFYEDSALL